ncbi:MAG: hypothetical protein ACK518_03760 [bacterium]
MNLLLYDGNIQDASKVEPNNALLGTNMQCVKVVDVRQVELDEIIYHIENAESNDESDSYFISENKLISVYDIFEFKIVDISIEEYLTSPDKYLGYKVPIKLPLEYHIEPKLDLYTFGYYLILFNGCEGEFIDSTPVKIRKYIEEKQSITIEGNVISLKDEQYQTYLNQLTLPPEYLFFSHQHLHHLLAGIIDASKRHKHEKLLFSNLKLYKQVKDVCARLGLDHVGQIEQARYTLNNAEYKTYYCSILIRNMIYTTASILEDRPKPSFIKDIINYPIKVSVCHDYKPLLILNTTDRYLLDNGIVYPSNNIFIKSKE